MDRGCFFFCFLRVDSLPLASDWRGEPGRLRLVVDKEVLRASPCFEGRWEGVLLPFEEVPEEGLGFALSFSGFNLLSSAFLRSSSLRRSASVSSELLCRVWLAHGNSSRSRSHMYLFCGSVRIIGRIRVVNVVLLPLHQSLLRVLPKLLLQFLLFAL